MGNWGIKVAREGYSINYGSVYGYVLNSSYSSVKIYSQYTGTLTINAGNTNTVSIEHGLPFVPLFIFYTELNPSSGKYFFGQVTNVSGGDADAGDCEIVSYADGNGDIVGSYADATYVKLQIKNNGVAQKTVKYRVIIFADNGQ